MLANNGGTPHYHYTSLDGHSFFDRYGCRAVLVWLSTRVFRTGPRLIIQIVAFIAAFFFIARALPQRTADIALGRGYREYWEWVKAKAGAHIDDASTDGLRVVVFGASDISTLPGSNGEGDMTWPEVMCEELECATYLSLVPPAPARSLSSNSLYAAAMQTAMGPSTNKTAPPGLDYSFFPKHYPVPWALPDLAAQVKDFLARPRPKVQPKETIWVFNLGHWDVWNLAALPVGVSSPVVEAMVSDVIVNIERLFRASHNPESIAHSTFRVEASKKPQASSGVDGEQTEVETEEPVTSFRVIVPMIFDATLAPGWRTERPDLPPAHSKAEQMRNAAALTELWNNKLQSAIEDWVRLDKDLASPSTTLYVTEDKTKPSATTPTPTATPEKPTRPILRDAVIYDLQEYLTEIMVERQLRRIGYVDHNGVGGAPEEKGFRDVAIPCVTPANATVAVGEDEAAARRRRSLRIARREEPVVAQPGVCAEPRDHLFYTGLGLSPRAIDDIGRETAELVTSNMTLRGYWASVGSSA